MENQEMVMEKSCPLERIGPQLLLLLVIGDQKGFSEKDIISDFVLLKLAYILGSFTVSVHSSIADFVLA